MPIISSVARPRTFLERCGLAAGAVAMFAINAYLTSLLSSHVFHFQRPRPPSQSIIHDSVLFSVAIAVALALCKIQKIPTKQIGFFDKHGAGRIMIGIFTGIVSVTVTLGILRLAHVIAFDGLRLHGPDAIRFALLWGAGFACIGLYEEFLFRGYMLIALGRGIGFWPAAIAMSFYFAFAHHHNAGENLLGLAGVFIFGMVLSIGVFVTNSLWWSIGFHAGWNWTQAYVFGTAGSGSHIQGQLMQSHPVGSMWLSGGTVGPEGSVFALFVAIVMPGLLLAFTRQRLAQEKRRAPALLFGR